MAQTSKEQLKEECEYIANELDKFFDPELYYSEEDSGFRIKDEKYDADDDIGLYGYIQNEVYDIKLMTDLNGTLHGVKLMVAGGGPNIYINTIKMEVEGYWGCDEYHVPLDYRICQRIDDEIEQLRGC